MFASENLKRNSHIVLYKNINCPGDEIGDIGQNIKCIKLKNG